jgi:hypothetical protein
MDQVPRQLLRHPIPEVADHRDVVLEIEVDGASQVKRIREDAI